MKPYVLAILVLGLVACGKQTPESKSHASTVAINHADATLVYYAMPG